MAKSNNSLRQSPHKTIKSGVQQEPKLNTGANSTNSYSQQNIIFNKKPVSVSQISFQNADYNSKISNYGISKQANSFQDLQSVQLPSENVSVQNINSAIPPLYPKNQNNAKLSPNNEFQKKIENFLSKTEQFNSLMNQINPKVQQKLTLLHQFSPCQKFWNLFDENIDPVFERCPTSNVTYAGQMVELNTTPDKNFQDKSFLQASMKDNQGILNSYISVKGIEDEQDNLHLEQSKINSGIKIPKTNFFVGVNANSRKNSIGADDQAIGIANSECKFRHSFTVIHSKKLTKEGFGVQIWPNGSLYIGFFSRGERNYQGRLIFQNGDFYEGDWINGVANGYGKYHHEDGTIYEGEFVEDKQEGTGKELWKDGSVYIGDFKDSLKWGNGCFVWRDGSMYKGSLVRNQLQGKGNFRFKIPVVLILMIRGIQMARRPSF